MSVACWKLVNTLWKMRANTDTHTHPIQTSSCGGDGRPLVDILKPTHHPRRTWELISSIQADFLDHAQAGLADKQEASLDRYMDELSSRNTPETTTSAEAMRVTPYQSPFDYQELAMNSAFVLECLAQHQHAGEIDFSCDGLESIPFASIYAPSMFGMVGFIQPIDNDDLDVPCILISEHVLRTAWVINSATKDLHSRVPEEDWQSSLGSAELRVPFDIDLTRDMTFAAMGAFLCRTGDVLTGMYDADSAEEMDECRLLLGFMMAHEYAHIVLGHRSRVNDETPLAMSSVRLAELSQITQQLSRKERDTIAVSTNRLRYFFGHQQDELHADQLAFGALYRYIRDQRDAEKTLRLFFRQVLNSLMWSEIHDVLGRTTLHGSAWASDILYDPQKALLNDIAWRKRYPSAYSRVSYLHNRAQLMLSSRHLEILDEEIREVELVFSIWRSAILGAGEMLQMMWNNDSEQTAHLRKSFVWKGLPNVARAGVGYSDHTEAFAVRSFSEMMERKNPDGF